MDPDMECHYKNLLHQWKNDEDTIKDELKKIGSDVEEFSTGIKEIGTNVKNLSKKLDDLVAVTMIPAMETNDEGAVYFKSYCDKAEELKCLLAKIN